MINAVHIGDLLEDNGMNGVQNQKIIEQFESNVHNHSENELHNTSNNHNHNHNDTNVSPSNMVDYENISDEVPNSENISK